MKKIGLTWYAVICLLQVSNAQSEALRDSLLIKLKISKEDTNKVKLLCDLGYQYYLSKPDTTYLLGQQAYNLSQKLNYKYGENRAYSTLAIAYLQSGDFANAKKYFQLAKEGFTVLKDTDRIVRAINGIGIICVEQNELHKGLEKFKEANAIHQNIQTRDSSATCIYLMNIGETSFMVNQLDSASYYLKKALEKAVSINSLFLGNILYDLGDVEFQRNNIPNAVKYYKLSLAASLKTNTLIPMNEAYYRLAKLYQKTGQSDSAVYCAKQALTLGQKSSFPKGVLRSAQLLSELYENISDKEALQYYKVAIAAKDSLFSQDKIKQMLSMSFEENQQEQRIVAAQTALKNKIRFYILGFVLIVLIVLALILWRNNRQKQRANILLHKQKLKIENQNIKIEKAFSELKTTQAQLIQSEKLASLGELTAGIAHEIQNPLNFVNNFSELSVDLINEVNEEMKNDVIDKNYLSELLGDLSQNQEKINHHGKRASSIVKGMLEHSRASTGVKELTDINKLTDEYLRLAYHGLRAKDKGFNCEIKTEFEENLPKIEVIPQDIGRVLLNLINNAFYAVNQRAQLSKGLKPLESSAIYTPSVVISTQQLGNEIIIKVTDNGIGMSDAIKAKVFQPFFTTKPTGQGTGLGLSLAYDIVTKGHGGHLEVESTEGEGSTFTILLPAAPTSSQLFH